MKKITSVLVFGIVAGFANTSAIAATACSGVVPTTGGGVNTVTAVAADKFVRTGFTPKCSANVILEYEDQTTEFAVAAGSTKGKTTFIGNSAGGGITASKTNTCAGTGCTTDNVDSALTEAKALKGGS